MARVAEVIGSQSFRDEENPIRRKQAEAAFDRGIYPPGTARQYCAIERAGNRKHELGKVRVPALVIHGTEDSFIHISGGRTQPRQSPTRGWSSSMAWVTTCRFVCRKESPTRTYHRTTRQETRRVCYSRASRARAGAARPRVRRGQLPGRGGRLRTWRSASPPHRSGLADFPHPARQATDLLRTAAPSERLRRRQREHPPQPVETLP